MLLTGLAGAVWNYVFTIQETTAQINRDWNEFTNASNAKGQLLCQIGMSLGYTGFIHNFKNYVIRHDPEYKRTVEAEFQRTHGVNIVEQARDVLTRFIVLLFHVKR